MAEKTENEQNVIDPKKEVEISYSDAFKELQGIVEEMEKEEIEVDTIVEKLKRAGFLLKICKAKLSETEKEAEVLLKIMKEEKD